MLNLARKLCLITGASFLGAVFAIAAGGAGDVTQASSDEVATGMQTTFAVATVLILIAFAVGSRGRAALPRIPRERVEPGKGPRA